MINKLLALLLAIMMCCLSGCALIDHEGDDDDVLQPPQLVDDYLVGMFATFSKYDAQTQKMIYFPANDFNDNQTISIYHALLEENGKPYYAIAGNTKYISDVSLIFNTKQTGVDVSINLTLYYTYEMLESTIRINGIYRKNGLSGHYAEQGGNGVYLNLIGSPAINQTQSLRASSTSSDGTVTEITYDFKCNVNIVFVDYLTDAQIIEFDSNHSVIKTSAIDLSQPSMADYATMQNCAYYIIEEKYEVMHDLDHAQYPLGTVYSKRYFF